MLDCTRLGGGGLRIFFSASGLWSFCNDAKILGRTGTSRVIMSQWQELKIKLDFMGACQASNSIHNFPP